MHELGIVFTIADRVTEVARENRVSHVNRVILEVGEVSMIVNSYLEDCWNWNANRIDLLRGCKLEIENIPAVTYCEGCGGKYPTVKFGKTCPVCQSKSTWLLQGNETNIKEIEVE